MNWLAAGVFGFVLLSCWSDAFANRLDSQAYLACSCYSADGYSNRVSLSYSVRQNYPTRYYWAGIFTFQPDNYRCTDYLAKYAFQQLTSGSYDFTLSTDAVPENSYYCALLESAYPIGETPWECNVTSSYYVTCNGVHSSQSSGPNVALIIFIVIGSALALLFCVTLILCLYRRDKERREAQAAAFGKIGGYPRDDNSLVDLSDSSIRSQDQAMTIPGIQPGVVPMMMPPNPAMQTGTAFSPYMTMPPAVYYMPNQNGDLTPMYMATNPMMMQTGQQQYFIQTNPQQPQ